MSMNKVIHGAVRRDLARFCAALEVFVEGDRARAAGLLAAWQNFDAQLTEHHEGEHEVAWPALEAIGIDTGTIATFDSEHEAMAADLASTRAAMTTFGRTATRADADAAAAAMGQLQTTTVTHLDHEEREIEPALVDRHDDPVIQDMGKRFGRRAGPPAAGTFFAWVQDGATAQELAALRQSVPGPVLAILGGLFGRRYRKEIAPVWH
jgi:hemerythrin-like domain-containing protein